MFQRYIAAGRPVNRRLGGGHILPVADRRMLSDESVHNELTDVVDHHGHHSQGIRLKVNVEQVEGDGSVFWLPAMATAIWRGRSNPSHWLLHSPAIQGRDVNTHAGDDGEGERAERHGFRLGAETIHYVYRRFHDDEERQQPHDHADRRPVAVGRSPLTDRTSATIALPRPARPETRNSRASCRRHRELLSFRCRMLAKRRRQPAGRVVKRTISRAVASLPPDNRVQITAGGCTARLRHDAKIIANPKNQPGAAAAVADDERPQCAATVAEACLEDLRLCKPQLPATDCDDQARVGGRIHCISGRTPMAIPPARQRKGRNQR